MNVTVQPELLRWARERASLAPDELAAKVGTKKNPAPIEGWEKSGELPLKKLEAIAAKTHAPFGMLFLAKPPDEPLPIRDFRRPTAEPYPRPSLNLLQTVYDAQFRQSWLSSHLQAEDTDPKEFVASASTADSPTQVANEVREFLRIGTEERKLNPDLGRAVLWMMGRLDEAGIVVQRNGVVGNHTKRKLDREEFKGFALADRWAPLIFINGNDWLASQMFTLAHECGHLWLGESGLPDGDWFDQSDDPTERWCNQVAAEILMPADELGSMWRQSEAPRVNARRLARHFFVSALAVLVRGRTLELIGRRAFEDARHEEEQAFSENAEANKGSGGDFYRTAKVRLGRRFIREVLVSTLEGTTLYSEAFELLGTRKTSVFEGLRERFLEGGEV